MKFKKLFIFLMLIFTVFLTYGCDMGGGTNSNGISRIEKDEDSFVSEAVIDEFDIRDWYIKVYYGNDTAEEYDLVQVTYNMLSSEDLKKLVKVGTHELTFTYEKKTITHTLTITKPNSDEIENVINAVASDDLIEGVASENFALPQTRNGVKISWVIEKNDYAYIQGTRVYVTRPKAGSSDATVKLTATFTYFEETLDKVYEVIIPAFGMEEIYNYLDKAINAVNVPSNISDELDLLFSFEDVEFVWSSSNTSVVVIDNTNKKVNVNPVMTNTTVTLKLSAIYDGNTYADYKTYSVNVIPTYVEVQAPSVSNLKVTDSTLSWNSVTGVSKYNVYANNKLIATVSNNSLNLSKYISADGTYTIGVQAVASGSYNVDSEIVTVSYTHEDKNISYTGSYYDKTNLNVSGNELKNNLRSLITNTHKHTTTYEELKKFTPKSDASLTNPSKVVLIYSRKEVQGTWSDGGYYWNREHVWPKSLGGFGESGAGADLHHLRPEDPVVNSTRNNFPFGEVKSGNKVKMSSQNGGEYTDNYLGGGYFEPQDCAKGDVARILLYLITRYSYLETTGITVVAQSMKMILEWNELDPVDEWEMQRNDVTEGYQGNRNPFIDHPELAREIWG